MKAYPKRRELFALHFVKWLVTSGTVNQTGPDAFALLVAVAMREDAVFYQRPPNYFNEQLAQECGIGSIPALIRARKRAVSLGLLEYIPGAKRRPGVYYVLGFPNESLPKAEGKRKESGRNPEGKRHPPFPIPSYPIPKGKTKVLGHGRRSDR